MSEALHIPSTYCLESSSGLDTEPDTIIYWYPARSVNATPICDRYASSFVKPLPMASDLQEADCSQCLRYFRREMSDLAVGAWERARTADSPAVLVIFAAPFLTKLRPLADDELYHSIPFGSPRELPDELDWKWYRRTREYEMVGTRMRARRALGNGFATLPAGSLWTVTRKARARSGISVRSDLCSDCGLDVVISDQSPLSFDAPGRGRGLIAPAVDIPECPSVDRDGKPVIVDERWYRRTTGKTMTGHWVRATRDWPSVSARGRGIVAGRAYVIERKFKGLKLRSEPCGTCGVRLLHERVPVDAGLALLE